MVVARVEGVENAIANLNKELNRIEGLTMAGLWAAGLTIQGRAMRHVPVEYGNLKGSAYTRRVGEIVIEKPEFAPRDAMTDKHVIEVGFGAAYALYVHENRDQTLAGQDRPSGLGVYWGPAGKPGFLLDAISNTKDLVDIAASYARKKS